MSTNSMWSDRGPRRVANMAALLAVTLSASACSWLSDFRQQPSIGPWQSASVTWADTTTPYRGQPQRSVPTVGTAVAAYEVSYAPTFPAIDSLAGVRNPVELTQASVDRGRLYYQINCAVCHGDAGTGNGPALRFGVPAPPLTADVTKNRTDGYIWGMMRNGRNLMPPMNRIDEVDRWHIVNYVRGLQGKAPTGITIATGAVAPPGVTGAALPGATRIGPNVPLPIVKPTYTPTGGAGATHNQERHE